VGAVEGRGAPEAVHVAHRLGNLDVPLGAHLLVDERLREDGLEVGGPGGLVRLGIEHRGHLDAEGLQVGVQVVPVRREIGFVEEELRLLVVGHGGERHSGKLARMHGQDLRSRGKGQGGTARR
jgi:hypothetical protein